MEIRILNIDDAEAYQALRLRGLKECPTSFGSSYPEEVTRSLSEFEEVVQPLSDGSRCVFGAFSSEEIMGVLSFARSRANNLRHNAILWGMYVALDHRKEGIGRALLKAAISHAQTLDGLIQIKLTVNAENSAARHLYQSAGFELYGIEPKALFVEGRYYDEEHYMLRIDSAERGETE